MSYSLYRRKNKDGSRNPIWQVKICLKGLGSPARRSTDTADKKRAREFAEKLDKEIYDQVALGEARGDSGATWENLKARWRADKSHKKSLSSDETIIAWLDTKGCLKGATLAEITDAQIAKIKKLLQTEQIPWKKDKATGEWITRTRKNSRVNRMLVCLQSMLNAATGWKLDEEVEKSPKMLAKAPEIELLVVPKRQRIKVADSAVLKLLSELPPHQLPIALLAGDTGFRKSNVTHLKWEWVDLPRRMVSIPDTSHKSNDMVDVPLSQFSYEIIKAQEGKHPVYVFVDHKGRAPCKSLKTAWNKARIRAGIPKFRFHDLRHWWTRNEVLRGTPEGVIQRRGGWKTRSMVSLYGELNAEEIRIWIDRDQQRPSATSTAPAPIAAPPTLGMLYPLKSTGTSATDPKEPAGADTSALAPGSMIGA